MERGDSYKEIDAMKKRHRINKIYQETNKNWDKFYQRNNTNFFKNRHWITKELHEYNLKYSYINLSESLTFLDVGCGVGNSLIPLLNENPAWSCNAIEFSQTAINLLKTATQKLSSRLYLYLCDISQQNIFDILQKNDFDLSIFIFVLSAIPSDRFEFCIKNVFDVIFVFTGYEKERDCFI